MTDDELISELHTMLVGRREAPEFNLLDRLPATTEDFAAFVQSAAEQATRADRCLADFAAAFGCEVGDVLMQETTLRSCRAHEFLRFIPALHKLTTEQVREALFGPWRYADRKPTLRYDPVDDRRHALRASDPGRDDIWTVRGANALASEALRLFPCAPRQRLATTGFSGDEGEPYFSWPIWITAIGPEVLRSLLNLAEVTAEQPDRRRLRALGVTEIFRVQRVKNGRYRNFTPAVPV
jgi:hypothetical protein